MSMETLFTKIEKGEIPSVKIYEDDLCFVIMDINPVVKGHALVISRKPYESMAQCPDEVLAHLIQVAKRVDQKQREVLKSQGSNVFINNDPASGQEVPHIHVHVVPRYENDGRKYFALHDKYEDGEMQKIGEKLKLN
jgi:histidine triad (HIT) family protein